MPPKQPFSVVRAQEFGDLAVVKATASFGHEGLPTGVLLDCTYRGVVTPDDGVDHGGEIAAKTTLVYIWNVVGGGFDDTQTKHVRACDAKRQGVPFPDTWKTALKCLQMPTLVGSALEVARQESDVADVACTFLGAARMTTPADPAEADPGETKPGAIAMMKTSGTSMAYILFALVRGSKWLCHRGTFDDRGKLNEKNPFDENNLVLS